MNSKKSSKALKKAIAVACLSATAFSLNAAVPQYQSDGPAIFGPSLANAASSHEVERENKRLAQEATDESGEINSSDFNSRIQAILNEMRSGQKFTPKAPAANPGPATQGQAPKTTDMEAERARVLAEIERLKQQRDGLEAAAETAENPLTPEEEALPTGDGDDEVSTAPGVYDFTWKGTPLAQSLYSLGSIAGKGIVVNGELTGTVYMNLKGVTCERALDLLSRAYNFNYMVDGDQIIISTDKLMLQTETFRIEYGNKAKIREEFKATGIDETQIYANEEQGTVSVTGTPYQLQRCKNILKSIDKPVAQVLLVAQLIEISHGKNVNLGLQYNLPTYNHVGTPSDNKANTLHRRWLEKFTFGASVQANRALSKGKVIARPMVMIMNGQKGLVEFGDQVPVLTSTATTASTSITVEYKDIGTKLSVTPVINERSGDVSMNVETEVSNITQWVTSGGIRAPQISTRKAITSAHLKSGQSFIIGGLMSANDLDNLSGIPGLMNLPILGKLFSYHTRSKTYGEIFVMLTPYIVTEDVNPAQILRQVEETPAAEDDAKEGKYGRR